MQTIIDILLIAFLLWAWRAGGSITLLAFVAGILAFRILQSPYNGPVAAAIFFIGVAARHDRQTRRPRPISASLPRPIKSRAPAG